MKLHLPVRLAAFMAIAVVVAGCGSSNSTAPVTGSVTQTTADDLAIQTVASMDLVGGDVQAAVGGTPTAPARAVPIWPHEARPARTWWDTTYSSSGITFEASRTYYDGSNNVLPGYGPTATWMRWTSRAYGTYEGPRDTATVGHSTSLDLHGLQSSTDTLRFDGTCADTLLNRFRSYDGTITHYFYWVSGETIDNVRFLKSLLSSPGGGHPISGTVGITVSADRLRSNNRVDVAAHFDAVILITFNGASPAVITVNGRFYYQWNLDTGQVTRV